MDSRDLSAPRVPVAIAPLALASVGGTLVFTASTLAMHLIQPGLDPVDVAVSYYMNGTQGWIQGLGITALGVGSLCLAWALRRAAVEERIGLGALVLWGVAVAIAGLFAPDPIVNWGSPPSFSGAVHANVAMIAFLTFPVAALRLSAPTADLASSPRLARRLGAVAMAGVAALALFFACLAPAFTNRAPVLLGLSERVLLLANVAWLVMAAVGVRRAVRRTAA